MPLIPGTSTIGVGTSAYDEMMLQCVPGFEATTALPLMHIQRTHSQFCTSVSHSHPSLFILLSTLPHPQQYDISTLDMDGNSPEAETRARSPSHSMSGSAPTLQHPQPHDNPTPDIDGYSEPSVKTEAESPPCSMSYLTPATNSSESLLPILHHPQPYDNSAPDMGGYPEPGVELMAPSPLCAMFGCTPAGYSPGSPSETLTGPLSYRRSSAPSPPLMAGDPLSWRKVTFAKNALREVLSQPLCPELLFCIHAKGRAGVMEISMETNPVVNRGYHLDDFAHLSENGRVQFDFTMVNVGGTAQGGVKEEDKTFDREMEIKLAEKLLEDWATYGRKRLGRFVYLSMGRSVRVL